LIGVGVLFLTPGAGILIFGLDTVVLGFSTGARVVVLTLDAGVIGALEVCSACFAGLTIDSRGLLYLTLNFR
jgi:hypothetical protein